MWYIMYCFNNFAESLAIESTVFESALDMEDITDSSIVDGGAPSLTIDATGQSKQESGEMTSSIPSTPSSPRQEPVGMNNEEEHFSVSFFFSFFSCSGL